MPRPAKRPRLYLHPKERVWLIRDGAVFRRTGCSERDSEGADKALAAYIAAKFEPAEREHHPDRVSIAEVLTAYGREHAPNTKAPATIGYAIQALVGWWGSRTLGQVRGETCRAYARARGETVKPGTVRRELGVLQAAINHWHAEHGPLQSIPTVTLPAKTPPRDRWLTRSEAALLLAGALGWYRERWSDVATRREHWRWRRYTPAINRHAARFILLGLATGTRSGALFSLQWMPNTSGGWVDLERGVLYRRAQSQSESKKRQPPVRLNQRVLSHLRRWKRIDDAARERLTPETGEPVAAYLHVVNFRGGPVLKIRRAWDSARELAGLDRTVTAHTLRHTRATWLMQAGIDLWEAAGALGMSVKTLEEVYGHHHPDWQQRAAEI